MQFEVFINGEPQFVAGISGRGHLGVHVNTKPSSETACIQASGYENLPDEETQFLKWQNIELKAGEELTIRGVLGRVVSAHESRHSSRDDARIAVRTFATANEIHNRVLSLQQQLLSMLPLVDTESPEDAKKFKRAVGTVLAAFGDHFLGPLYNAHPALRPEELSGVPL